MTHLEDLEKEKFQSNRQGLRPSGLKEDDYRRGRNGDHIICYFQCDLCVFRKLRGVDPRQDSELDKLTCHIFGG